MSEGCPLPLRQSNEADVADTLLLDLREEFVIQLFRWSEMEAMRRLLGNIHLSFHPFVQVVFAEHVLVEAAGLGSELHEAWRVPLQSLHCAGGNQTALPGNLGSGTRQALGQLASCL